MQVLHMNKGKGETSYANNSQLQKKIISVGSSMVEEAIVNILLENYPESMGLADLGCSSGPNTLTLVNQIIDVVYATTHQMGRPVPELRVSLNDLPGNDFNGVFMLLPDFYKKLKRGYCIPRCFVSGMPGSFYGRLFPTRSLHLVHSSSSLHWLSQVPSGLDPYTVDTHLNKGKIYISKSSPSRVVELYQQQFHEDFSLFLKSRAEEMVTGGRMVLSFMGRRCRDTSADESCYQWELLARALTTLALDGYIEMEKIDSFNAPYYAPCPEEVQAEVKKEGSFVVNHVESYEIEWDGGPSSNENDLMESLSSGQRVAKTIRAVVEPMLESHFQLETKLMYELFRRYAQIIDECFFTTKKNHKYINLVFSFIRKG